MLFFQSNLPTDPVTAQVSFVYIFVLSHYMQIRVCSRPIRGWWWLPKKLELQASTEVFEYTFQCLSSHFTTSSTAKFNVNSFCCFAAAASFSYHTLWHVLLWQLLPNVVPAEDLDGCDFGVNLWAVRLCDTAGWAVSALQTHLTCTQQSVCNTLQRWAPFKHLVQILQVSVWLWCFWVAFVWILYQTAFCKDA